MIYQLSEYHDIIRTLTLMCAAFGIILVDCDTVSLDELKIKGGRV